MTVTNRCACVQAAACRHMHAHIQAVHTAMAGQHPAPLTYSTYLHAGSSSRKQHTEKMFEKSSKPQRRKLLPAGQDIQQQPSSGVTQRVGASGLTHCSLTQQVEGQQSRQSLGRCMWGMGWQQGGSCWGRHRYCWAYSCCCHSWMCPRLPVNRLLYRPGCTAEATNV